MTRSRSSLCLILFRLILYADVIINLEVMGFLRVVLECLLASAKHTCGWTASESVNMHEVGKAIKVHWYSITATG
jgi:hypothetical protein